MNKNLRTRGIVIGLVAFFSLLMMFGPWNRPKEAGKLKASDFIKLKQNLSENIKLGLDLKGGTHLVLQVQTDDALKALTEGNQSKAVEILKKENIVYKDVKVPANGQVVVETRPLTKCADEHPPVVAQGEVVAPRRLGAAGDPAVAAGRPLIWLPARLLHRRGRGSRRRVRAGPRRHAPIR